VTRAIPSKNWVSALTDARERPTLAMGVRAMKKTRRASDTKAGRGGFEAPRIAARERTLQKTAGRQFAKTRAKVIQSHTRARGQRNQARRDARS
jgi:hypothetical protein